MSKSKKNKSWSRAQIGKMKEKDPIQDCMEKVVDPTRDSQNHHAPIHYYSALLRVRINAVLNIENITAIFKNKTHFIDDLFIL